MVDTRQLDELARRLARTLPPGLTGFRRELEENFRAILQNNLEKLDLVSRERFEASQALLVATRTKLDALEAKVTELEKRRSSAAPKQTAQGQKTQKADS